jgi:hypothetical protein
VDVVVLHVNNHDGCRFRLHLIGGDVVHGETP